MTSLELERPLRTIAEVKITKARSVMIQSQRFFGSLALRLHPKASTRIATVASDGVSLLYNPTWIETAEDRHVVALCAKMAAHIALLHHTRRRGREQKRWQRACDYAANPLIEGAEFSLPDEALINPAYAGKSAEEIYRLMPPDEDGEGGGQGQGQGADQGSGAANDAPGELPPDGNPDAPDGEDDQKSDDGGMQADPGGCGQVLDAVNEDGSKPSQADAQQIEANTQVAVVQAENLAKAAGQGHADLDRIVDNIKKAQTDWREELRRFMLQSIKSDYTWSRPNRRFISQDVYLPSLHGQAMGEMIVAIDTSGSVIDWLDDFAKELSGIIEDTKPSKVTVLYCDDRVAGVDELTVEDLPLKLTAKGMGGTSFCPAFDYVRDQGIDPAVFVYLTDLIGQAPKEAPEYPVVWAVTNDNPAPWGERVRLRR